MHSNLWPQFAGVALAMPEHPAFLQGDRALSFGDLHAAALDVSLRLGAAGMSQGDRCVIWAGNSFEMATAILGVIAAGAIPALLNVDAPASHFENAVGLTQAQVALVDPSRIDVAQFDGATIGLDQIITTAAQGGMPSAPISVAGSQPASILFTSGSSGLPKGVTQSHENLLWGCRTLGKLQGLTQLDRILCAIPWSFDYGWGQFLSTCLLGITQVLPVGRGAAMTCDAIVQHRPTVLPGVPSLFADLVMGVSPIRDIDRSTIRLITNTGSKIPSTLFPEIRELFPDAEISLNYGLTETYRSTSLPTKLCAKHPESVGYAVPGVTISVVDDAGREAKCGEVGEIVHRGAGVFLGYWGEPERTMETRREWHGCDDAKSPSGPAVFTGDLGWKDDRGLLYIKGRRDRQIKSMGVRVSPDEVESLIVASGLVSAAAVIPRNHATIGQQVVAVVTPIPGDEVSIRDLRKMARETMSPFMQPMVWMVVDALPRTPNDKVDYVALKSRFGNEGPQ